MYMPPNFLSFSQKRSQTILGRNTIANTLWIGLLRRWRIYYCFFCLLKLTIHCLNDYLVVNRMCFGLYYRKSQAMVTTCAIVTITDNWQESLPTLTTDHFSPECYSETRIDFFILAYFIVLMCIVAICQRFFKRIYGYGYGTPHK